MLFGDLKEEQNCNFFLIFHLVKKWKIGPVFLNLNQNWIKSNFFLIYWIRSKNDFFKNFFFQFKLIFLDSQKCKTGNSESKSILNQKQKKNFNFNFSLSTFNFNFFIFSFSLKNKKKIVWKKTKLWLVCSSYFLLWLFSCCSLQLIMALDSWTCEESWKMILIISSSPLKNLVAKFSN